MNRDENQNKDASNPRRMPGEDDAAHEARVLGMDRNDGDPTLEADAARLASKGRIASNPDRVGPLIHAVQPRSGSQSGGDIVYVIGSQLTGATSVRFGHAAGTDLKVISDTEIEIRTPAGMFPGTCAVSVTTPAGRSSSGDATKAATFTYIPAGPAIPRAADADAESGRKVDQTAGNRGERV